MKENDMQNSNDNINSTSAGRINPDSTGTGRISPDSTGRINPDSTGYDDRLNNERVTVHVAKSEQDYITGVKAELARAANLIGDEPKVYGFLVMADTGDRYVRLGAGAARVLRNMSRDVHVLIPRPASIATRLVVAWRVLWAD